MSQKRKLGQGSAQAAFRKGFRELGAITKAFPDSLAVPDEAGQLWSTTQQHVSQQIGVSMPVHRSESYSQGAQQMNPTEPDTPTEPTAPETEITPDDSILDDLVDNAQAMSQEQEMEQSVELEP
ncbi:hypothetical protein [Roseiconus lacunae]|uniref:hypothetical protein n=1 Tax=Roseiconus lacunae TaxID=2605694 RepID=UPI001E4398AE|nr:hypothetical protein [Roseiconus lacunae]MCD0458131.1 hypothetical protein [Roseiconus lacunae]